MARSHETNDQEDNRMTDVNVIDARPPSTTKAAAVVKTAAIFDLYGTLMRLETRPLLRKISKYLKVRPTPEKLRSTMTLKFPDEVNAVQGFIEILLEREATCEEVDHCLKLVNEHLATANVIKGAVPLLTFLKRRGMKLALLSNVAQIFKQPFYDLGLDQYFDVIHFSSDTQFRKPQKEAYLGVCDAMGVNPKQCLFFGDDAKNDYDGPLALHMRPVHIGKSPRAETVDHLSDLLWVSTNGERLLRIGQKVKTDNGTFTVREIEQLNDADLGIYNVVARAHGENQNGEPETWYVKRFLDTSSVHVEHTAHALMELIGITVPRAFLTQGTEPILFTSPAKGRLWQEGDNTLEIAEELGAQAASAYIISNADWRPRNTFACPETGVLTCIDLEHCLFDRVLTLADTGLDVNDPKAIDSLGITTSHYTRTRVLSYGAVRRARRSFTPNEDRNSQELQLFFKGWDRTFVLAAQNKQSIADAIRSRMDAGKLIVGTKSHRRAFAGVDLHDLLERIDLGRSVVYNDAIWSTKK
jgi:HAD superfamily hydrolase (TIGR01549 family)